VKLSEVLPESAVRLGLDGKDKWEVIDVLTAALVESGQVSGDIQEAVREALVTREKSMSTGMEKGIAIPHASVEVVEKTAVALGIAEKGVEFEAIDGQTTHLVFLLVNPSNKTKIHIRTLAEIARLTSSAELRKSLREASTVEEALERIRRAEAGSA